MTAVDIGAQTTWTATSPGFLVGGQAALRDESDTTYYDNPPHSTGTLLRGTFGPLGVTYNSIRGFRLRLRAASFDGWTSMGFDLRDPSNFAVYRLFFNVPPDGLVHDYTFTNDVPGSQNLAHPGVPPYTAGEAFYTPWTNQPARMADMLANGGSTTLQPSFDNSVTPFSTATAHLQVYEMKFELLAGRTPLRARQRTSGVTGDTPLRARNVQPYGVRARQNADL